MNVVMEYGIADEDIETLAKYAGKRGYAKDMCDRSTAILRCLRAEGNSALSAMLEPYEPIKLNQLLSAVNAAVGDLRGAGCDNAAQRLQTAIENFRN